MVFVAVYDIFRFVSDTIEYFCCNSYFFVMYANVPHIFIFNSFTVHFDLLNLIYTN